jgi:hypothetical protein
MLYMIFFFMLISTRGDILSYLHEQNVAISILSSAAQKPVGNEIAAINEVNNKAQAIGWPFLIMPILSGSIVFGLFRRFSPVMQDLTLRHFDIALVMPSALTLVLLITGLIRFEVTTSPLIRGMNMPRLFPWFLVFNGGMWAYAQLSFRNKIAEWVPVLALRKLIAPMLLLLLLALSTLALVF